jgi:DNA-binding transcriptional LysR family regulator
VIGDEWEYQPLRVPAGVERVELLRDPLRLVLPAGHPPVRIADLADERWVTGPAGLGWDEMTVRLCRDLGGFEPDIAHRTNDATIATALVARGLGVTLLPDLSLAPYGGVAVHPIAERPMSRILFAATRTTDAARPSTQAVLEAIRYAASAEVVSSA